MASLPDRLRNRIEAQGPLSVAQYVEAALYDPDDGFYTAALAGGDRAARRPGQAGRRGDFLTAPEIGPLFGAVVAGALDRWWDELGRPAPFVVQDWGAGPGTLARAVIEARPAVLTAGALRWWAIELSALQRAAHPDHPVVVSGSTRDEVRGGAGWTAGRGLPVGVVLANELLDNLPFDIYEFAHGSWLEQRVSLGPDGHFVIQTVTPTAPVDPLLPTLVADPSPGTAIPWQRVARDWVTDALGSIARGRVVVFDYGAPTAELAARGGWLRTHRAHDGAGDWLDEPGTCDITVDVATDQIQSGQPADLERSQADFLRTHGIDELVEEGRAAWAASAHVGDLDSLKARSRIGEAEALLDPAGMGAFRVLEWVV